MLRKFLKVSLSSALGAMALVLTLAATGGAEDKKDEKVTTIKEIMQKGHKGTDAFIAKIKAEAKEGKWDEAKAHAKALAVFGEHLGKSGEDPVGMHVTIFPGRSAGERRGVAR